MKLSVEISPQLNQQLKDLAKRDMRTLMAYAAKVLEAHVAKVSK